MYNLDNILKEIIKNNRRVIIPELGAFIKNDNKPIVFSSLLKYNDGFLENELQKKGIANPDSFIKSFVEDILYVINEEQIFNIEGLGYFYKENGNIQFNFQISDESAVYGNNLQTATILDSEIEPASNNEEQKKDKKGIIWVIIAAIILILIILGALYFFWFNTPGSKQLKPLIPKTEKPENQFIISDKAQEQKNNSDESEKEENESPAITINNFEYHVIAGCFEEKINADNFVAQCKKEGYDKTQIISKIGDLYPVSISSFATMEEALDFMGKYEEKYDEEAWIYKIK